VYKRQNEEESLVPLSCGESFFLDISN